MAAANERAAGVLLTPTTAQDNADAHNSIATQQDDKPWTRFRAECALAGVQSWLAMENGKPLIIVSSYGRTREFKSMQEARAWIDGVTGAAR